MGPLEVLIVIVWLALIFGVVKLAQRNSRSVGLWVVVAILISPVLALIILALMGPSNKTETSGAEGQAQASGEADDLGTG